MTSVTWENDFPAKLQLSSHAVKARIGRPRVLYGGWKEAGEPGSGEMTAGTDKNDRGKERVYSL